MIELNYGLTQAEYIDYAVYTAWDAPHKKRFRLTTYGRLTVLAASITIIALTLLKFELLYSFVLAGFFIVMIFCIPNIQKNAIRDRAKRLMLNEENKLFFSSVALQLSATGIHSSRENMNATYKWNSIVRKVENETSYFLYTNSEQAIVIPKRVLKTPEQKRDFERMLNEHISLQAEFETES